jgi:hypothetical protein
MKQAHSTAMRTVLGGVGLLLAVGCVDAAPCSTTCPKIEGTYAMSYEATTIESPDCASIPAPTGPSSIVIVRSGAEIRATIFGIPGRGMLQETSDFSIAADETPDGGADAGTQSYVLRGYFLPPAQRGLDGGTPATILGKWITHAERGAKVCDAERPYTGIKQ